MCSIEDQNANDSMKYLHDTIKECIEKSKFTKTYKKTPRKPWMTPSTLELSIKVDRLRRKFLRKNSADNEIEYREAKKLLQKTIRKDKINYYQNSLKSCQSDGKKTWMLINQCLGRYKNISDNKNPIEFDGELVADHEKIANNMNEFYITMGHYMSKQLPDPINNSDYTRVNNHLMK